MRSDVLGQERYRLDRMLGVGAMGTVHLARDTVLDRPVAVKVLAGHLAADETFRRRFVREARLSARLCHPNVVQIFDAGDDGEPFLVMEYVDGETVADRLAPDRRFTHDELLSLVTQLSAGLAHAHARGIVHRDVKPHNVLLRRDGVAKLTDFGIARAVADGGLTEVGTVLGTAPYMAPEQAAGQEVGPAADVYALGALTRNLAAGPLPSEFDKLVEAALRPDPAARPSAAELHRRLAALRDGEPDVVVTPIPGVSAEAAPTELSRPAVTELAPPTVGGRADTTPVPRILVALAAAFVLFILVAALLVARSGPETADTAPPTATTAPTTAPTTGTTAVPPADPAQVAHDLADWLRSQAR